jgi:hypothetical protein
MHDDHTPAGREAPEAEEPGAGEPRPDEVAADVERPARHPDPTRYGDWEKGGRCIDF